MLSKNHRRSVTSRSVLCTCCGTEIKTLNSTVMGKLSLSGLRPKQVLFMLYADTQTLLIVKQRILLTSSDCTIQEFSVFVSTSDQLFDEDPKVQTLTYLHGQIK